MFSNILKIFGKEDGPPVVTELVLPSDAAKESDASAIIQCNIDYVNYLLETALYMPAQVIPEPFWSYQVDYYLCQVKNGGHGQYVYNSNIISPKMKLTIESTQRGLAAMGALDFATIYEDLLRILAKRPLDACAVDALDDCFWKLDVNSVDEKNRAFLLGLPCLRLVPRESWADEMEKLGRLNPNYEKQAKALQREREKRAANDPIARIGKMLCKEAHRTFIRALSIRSWCELDGERVVGAYIQTDKGPAVIIFLEFELLLFNIGGELPDIMKMPPEEAAKWLSDNNEMLLSRNKFSRNKDLIAAVKTP